MKSLKLTTLSRWGRISALSLLVVVTVGCDDQTKQQGRYLKKTVELRNVTAHNILLPGGGNFDFETVANWQMVDELNKNDHFVIPVKDPSANLYEPSSLPRTEGAPIATKPSMVPDQNVPSCLKDKAQVVIGGQINSFEMMGNGGFCIGYQSSGGQCNILGLGASLMIQSARMDMGVHAWSPFYNNYLVGTGNATANQTETSIKAGIDFHGLQLSPELFFKTRLADVTRTGIRRSLEALVNNMDDRAINEHRPLWEGQVVVSTESDNYIKINAGRMHLLRAGDEFEIYNVRTVWEGAVCNSAFTRETTTTKPVAVVKIAEEGDLDVTYAYAKIMEGTGDRIYPGAVVRIRKLVGDAGQDQPTENKSQASQMISSR